MKITLQTLIGADACISAQKEFVNTFGDDGSVTPKQLFKAIAKLGRKDWLWWSALHISGFAEAIGNYKSGNFYLAISGEVQVVGAFVLAFNNSTVEALGNSTVMAFDNSTVNAFDNSTVRAFEYSTVMAWGNSTVLMDEYSLKVKFVVRSKFACVVDRRNGVPQSITVANALPGTNDGEKTPSDRLMSHPT